MFSIYIFVFMYMCICIKNPNGICQIYTEKPDNKNGLYLDPIISNFY